MRAAAEQIAKRTVVDIAVAMKRHEGASALYTAAVMRGDGVQADEQRAMLHVHLDEVLDAIAAQHAALRMMAGE